MQRVHSGQSRHLLSLKDFEQLIAKHSMKLTEELLTISLWASSLGLFSDENATSRWKVIYKYQPGIINYLIVKCWYYETNDK